MKNDVFKNIYFLIIKLKNNDKKIIIKRNIKDNQFMMKKILNNEI